MEFGGHKRVIPELQVCQLVLTTLRTKIKHSIDRCTSNDLKLQQ
jgi:hypothetical protein